MCTRQVVLYARLLCASFHGFSQQRADIFMLKQWLYREQKNELEKYVYAREREGGGEGCHIFIHDK